jgi:hypothetical protein
LKTILTLTQYSQIKALCDPFRVEMMMRLMEKPYTARRFTPSADLLPYIEDGSESSRQLFLQLIERTKSQILASPEEALNLKKPLKIHLNVGSLWEFSATQTHFNMWINKFFNLMGELKEMTKDDENDPNSKVYLISTTALQIDETSIKQLDNEKNES